MYMHAFSFFKYSLNIKVKHSDYFLVSMVAKVIESVEIDVGQTTDSAIYRAYPVPRTYAKMVLREHYSTVLGLLLPPLFYIVP